MKPWLIAVAAAGTSLLATDPSVAMPRSTDVAAAGAGQAHWVCSPTGRCYRAAGPQRVVRHAARSARPPVHYARRPVHYARSPVAVYELDAPRPGLRFGPMYGYLRPGAPAPIAGTVVPYQGCGPYTCAPAYSFNYSYPYGYAPTQWGGSTVGIGFGF